MKIFLAQLLICGLSLADYAGDQYQPDRQNQPTWWKRQGKNWSMQQRNDQESGNRNNWNNDRNSMNWAGKRNNRGGQWNTNNQQQPTSFWDQKMMGLPKRLANVFGYEMKQPYYYNSCSKPDYKMPIKVTMYVRMLGPVCTKSNTMKMQVTFRESYYDKRLKNLVEPYGVKDYITLVGEDVSMIWTPDTFFRNSVEEEFMGSMQPNQYARIYPSGKVLLSRRISLKNACPYMEEKFMAGSVFNCSLAVASYGYKTDDLHYMADNEHDSEEYVPSFDHHDVQDGATTCATCDDDVTRMNKKNKSLKMTRYATAFLGKYNDQVVHLQDTTVEEETVETSTGHYSVLKFNFALKPSNP